MFENEVFFTLHLIEVLLNLVRDESLLTVVLEGLIDRLKHIRASLSAYFLGGLGNVGLHIDDLDVKFGHSASAFI